MSNPKETPFSERRQAGTTQGHQRDPCRETNAQGHVLKSVGRSGGALASDKDVGGSDEAFSTRYSNSRTLFVGGGGRGDQNGCFQVSFGEAFPFGPLNNTWETYLGLSGPHS